MRQIMLLTLICAALALAILAETREATVAVATPSVPAPTVPPRPGLPSAAAAADTRIAAILARPLFTPDRRPAAQVAPSAPPQPDGPTTPRLTAIIAGPFGRRAIIAGLPGRRSLTVSVGDQVQEFHVQSIDDRVVVLNGPAGSIQLRPTYPGAPPTAPAPTAAPTPAFDLPPGVLPEDVAPPANKGRTP